jgi:hypothetical protein
MQTKVFRMVNYLQYIGLLSMLNYQKDAVRDIVFRHLLPFFNLRFG